LKTLEWLDLRDTKITDAGLKSLKGLTNLRSLSLQGTRVTAAGAKELQQALRKCKIEWEPPTKD
jgi:hypothetical protein